MSWSPRDYDIAVRTMLGEAANQGRDGLAAVAHVLQNRARDSRWGGSIADVALAPKQFSTWNEGAGGNSIPRSVSPNDPQYQLALEIAREVAEGRIPDMTMGATHYYSPAGMRQLVSDGHQSNEIPRWLQEETNRRGGETTTIGGHIFTGRGEGWMDPQAPISTSILRDDGSAIPYADAALLNEAAEASGQELPFDLFGVPSGIAPPRQDLPWLDSQPFVTNGPTGGGSGGNRGPSGNQGALSQVVPEEVDDRTFWQKLIGKDDKQADLLLAIGSGLLSGNDWASGIAAAGENVLGLRLNDKDFERQKELKAMDAQNSARNRMEPAGNMRMADGSMRGDLRWNGEDWIDPQGNVVTDQVGGRINNSDYAGSRGQFTAQQAMTMQNDLNTTVNTLTSFDRIIESMDTVDFGSEGFVNTIQAAFNTLMGKGLTPEQLQLAIARGDMQAVIGLLREQIVGPGVMTEQDAGRILMAIGGDMSILTNPDLIKNRISMYRDYMLRNYESMANQYEVHNQMFPHLGYQPHTRYMPPGALNQSNAGGTAPATGGNTPSADPVIRRAEEILQQQGY
jgi:hypothetical protein